MVDEKRSQCCSSSTGIQMIALFNLTVFNIPFSAACMLALDGLAAAAACNRRKDITVKETDCVPMYSVSVCVCAMAPKSCVSAHCQAFYRG